MVLTRKRVRLHKPRSRRKGENALSSYYSPESHRLSVSTAHLPAIGQYDRKSCRIAPDCREFRLVHLKRWGLPQNLWVGPVTGGENMAFWRAVMSRITARIDNVQMLMPELTGMNPERTIGKYGHLDT